MKKFFLVFLISFTFFNSGCDNSLDIVSEYKEQLAAFLVLDSRSDKQIIKVQKVQKSPGVPTLEKLVDPVSVRIVDPLGYSRTFKDTVINTVSNYNTLYIDSLDLIPGTYQLVVSARDSLHAESNIVVQQKPNYYVTVVIPPTRPPDDSIFAYFLDVSAHFMSSPHVIYAHIKPYLLYTIMQNSEYVEKSIEVTGFSFNMLRIPPGSTEKPYRIRILKDIIKTMRDKLIKDGASVYGMKFVFHTYTTDLYQYISLYEGYSNSYSVRLDKPNYSNIVGGVGIFGAVFVDSVITRLPPL